MTDFVTKDSGQRQQWESGMMRDVQTGKPRFALVVTSAQPYEDQMLTRYARLLARGAEKYEDRNWEKGSGEKELEYAKESLLRHTMQLITGETDEDHAAAVWFNSQVIEYIRWKQDQYVKDFNEAVADGYATEWLAQYDAEHPAAAPLPDVVGTQGDWKDVGWMREPGDFVYEDGSKSDHSHPGRAGGLYDGPDEGNHTPPQPGEWQDPIAEWKNEQSLQRELERQLGVDQARPEPTPFSEAVQRYADRHGFEPSVTALIRAEREAAERLLAPTDQTTFPIVPAPNPVQLGLDRDQRSL